MRNQRSYRSRWLLLGVMTSALLVAGSMVPAVRNAIRCCDGQTDYLVHLKAAGMMASSHDIIAPHFLYHGLVALGVLAGLGLGMAGGAVSVGAYAALGGGLFGWFWSALPGSGDRRRLVVGLVAVAAVVVVTPITLATIPAKNLYFGYQGIITYHNPTIVLLRPLALGLFVLVVGVLHRRRMSLAVRPWTYAAICALTVVSTLAKPSYAICLVPALGLVAVTSLRTKRVLGALFCVALPAAAVLAFQYLARYGGGIETSGDPRHIVFAPLAVRSYRSGDLLVKASLSIAFPLVLLGTFARRAWQDIGWRLSWFTAIVGVGYAYLLAEADSHGVCMDGNFGWSAQISLFILFAASVRLLLLEAQAATSASPPRRYPIRWWLCWTILGLHVVSGVVFYVVTAMGQGRYWW